MTRPSSCYGVKAAKRSVKKNCTSKDEKSSPRVGRGLRVLGDEQAVITGCGPVAFLPWEQGGSQAWARDATPAWARRGETAAQDATPARADFQDEPFPE